MDIRRYEAEISRNNGVFASFEEYKRDIKTLKVTPLLLPYDVQHEVCKELDKAIDFKPGGCVPTDVHRASTVERY